MANSAEICRIKTKRRTYCKLPARCSSHHSVDRVIGCRVKWRDDFTESKVKWRDNFMESKVKWREDFTIGRRVKCRDNFNESKVKWRDDFTEKQDEMA